MRAFTSLLLLAACGSNNELDVNGGTKNEVIVEYRAPICEDPVFETAKDKLKCLRALTSLKIDGEIRVEDLQELTPEQAEVLNAN